MTKCRRFAATCKIKIATVLIWSFILVEDVHRHILGEFDANIDEIQMSFGLIPATECIAWVSTVMKPLIPVLYRYSLLVNGSLIDLETEPSASLMLDTEYLRWSKTEGILPPKNRSWCQSNTTMKPCCCCFLWTRNWCVARHLTRMWMQDQESSLAQVWESKTRFTQFEGIDKAWT